MGAFTMTIVIPVLLATTLALLVRLGLVWYYRRWINQGLFGDSAYHYCIVRALDRQRRGYVGVPEFLIRNGPDRYPILFHRFASLFGVASIERSPFLPNLLLFVLVAGAVPAVAALLPGEFVPMGEGAESLGLLAAALFITSVPNNSMRGDGVLFLSLSERLMAKLSVSFYFLFVLVWSEYGSWPFLGLASVAGAVALSTSMFARQALFFTTLGWALCALDLGVLLPMAGSILLCAAVRGGDFFLALRDQWGFSASYRTYTAHSRVFREALSEFASVRATTSPRALLRQVATYEPGKSILRHGDLILVAAAWPLLDKISIALLGATVGVYLLTTTKTFRHFGESERYIDYNLSLVLPFLLARAIVLSPSMVAVALLAIAAVYRLLVISIALWREAGRSIEGTDTLRQVLNDGGITQGSRVLPLPINFGQTISARTGCKVVCYPGVYGAWIFERYIDEYPLFKRPLDAIAAEFEVSHIVLNKAQTERAAQAVGWSYDLTRYRVLSENEHWCCYEFR